jgi:hypothetical protein
MLNVFSPKQRFIEQGNPAALTAWRDQCAEAWFREILERTLAEYVVKQRASAATDAAASYYRIEGATAFIHTLLNLGEQHVPKQQAVTPQLDPV